MLFADYTSYLKTINNSKRLPDLAILDYTLENHLISKSPYELLYEMKQYMPLVFYNDPCIAEGARVTVWRNFIETMENRDFAPKDQLYIPPIEEIEKILILIVDFIESPEFRPYIKLMQKPKDFPKELTLDYLAENFTKAGSFSISLLSLKNEMNLPDNLFTLFQIFYENKNTILEPERIRKMYEELKSPISDKTLCVLISQLRFSLKKLSIQRFFIKKYPTGYKLETE